MLKLESYLKHHFQNRIKTKPNFRDEYEKKSCWISEKVSNGGEDNEKKSRCCGSLSSNRYKQRVSTN